MQRVLQGWLLQRLLQWELPVLKSCQCCSLGPYLSHNDPVLVQAVGRRLRAQLIMARVSRTECHYQVVQSAVTRKYHTDSHSYLTKSIGLTLFLVDIPERNLRSKQTYSEDVRRPNPDCIVSHPDNAQCC